MKHPLSNALSNVINIKFLGNSAIISCTHYHMFNIFKTQYIRNAIIVSLMDVEIVIMSARNYTETFKLHLVVIGFNIHGHKMLERARVLVLQLKIHSFTKPANPLIGKFIHDI